MATAHVILKRIIVDSQELQCYEPDDDHMFSRLFFDLEVGGNHYNDMLVEVRQPYGTQFESEPLEVSNLRGPYNGNWNHNEFRDQVEKYYKNMIGKEGKMVRTTDEGRNTVCKNCTFQRTVEFDIDIPDM